MNTLDQQYLNLVEEILSTGTDRTDRTGVGTRAITGAHIKFDMSKGEFPLITSKYVNAYAAIRETEWFTKGLTNIKWLKRAGVGIWDEWAYPIKDDIGDRSERPLGRVPVSAERVRTIEENGMSQYDLSHIEDEPGEFVSSYKRYIDNSDPSKHDYDSRLLSMCHRQWLNAMENTYLFMHSIAKSVRTFDEGIVYSGCLMGKEFHDFSVFVKHVLDRRTPGFHGILEGHILTPIYYLSDVLTPRTAMFLSEYEIEHYEDQIKGDQIKTYKVKFKQDGYPVSRPPMIVPSDMEGYLKLYVDDVSKIESIMPILTPIKETKYVLRHMLTNGELGPVYGKQWRAYGENDVDQLKNAYFTLIDNPYSRRIIVDSWSPEEVSSMQLPPCHLYYQFTVDPIDEEQALEWLSSQDIDPSTLDDLPTQKLNLSFVMRSNDVGLGLPFNFVNYATLLLKMASASKMVPGQICYNGIDVHIYHNHLEQLSEQLTRETFDLPSYKMSDWGSDYRTNEFNDDPVQFKVNNYKHGGKLYMPVAV